MKMFRNVAKTFVRRYSSGYGMSAQTGSHDTKMWKYLSFFVVLPIGACYINAHIQEKEEQENWEHHRPEYKPYSHMRLRSKQFPWGDGNHTLFHNKKINALPDGYEE